MIPAWFVAIAVVIRLAGGISYARAVVRGRAKPNPVTWFFWALTALVAFAAQISSGVGWSAISTFALALGPLVIFSLALKHNWSRSHFTPATIACAVLAMCGIILWQLTSNPTLAIIFSIVADIFGSIPTVIKAYQEPQSEVSGPYLASMCSMVITLLTINDWNFASYAFPAYIFLINFVIFSTTRFELGIRAWTRSKT